MLTDYDVINRGLTFESFSSSDLAKESLVILEPTRVPCAVWGDAKGYFQIVDMIKSYRPKPGESHVSDMEILRKQPIQYASLCVEHGCTGQPIRDHVGPGWEEAPLLHCATASMRRMGFNGSKAEFVRSVLEEL